MLGWIHMSRKEQDHSRSTRFPRQGKPAQPPSLVYKLSIELRHVEPRVWRTILVPNTLTLAQLDHVVRSVMGWSNSHLHEWHIGTARYSMPDTEWDALDETRFTIGEVLGDHVTEFAYAYDPGDNWEHRVIIDDRFTPDFEYNTWPMCIAGANACPPEDIGGPASYEEFAQVITNPSHPEHLTRWQEYGGPFDPAAFSVNQANDAIYDRRRT